MNNVSKIVDLEYRHTSEEQEIPESNEMGVAVEVSVDIAFFVLKLAFVLGIIGIGVAIFQTIFP